MLSPWRRPSSRLPPSLSLFSWLSADPELDVRASCLSWSLPCSPRGFRERERVGLSCLGDSAPSSFELADLARPLGAAFLSDLSAGWAAWASKMLYTKSCFFNLSSRVIPSLPAICRSSATFLPFNSMMSNISYVIQKGEKRWASSAPGWHRLPSKIHRVTSTWSGLKALFFLVHPRLRSHSTTRRSPIWPWLKVNFNMVRTL